MITVAITGELVECCLRLRIDHLNGFGAIPKRRIGLILERMQAALHQLGIRLQGGLELVYGHIGIKVLGNFVSVAKRRISASEDFSRFVADCLSCSLECTKILSALTAKLASPSVFASVYECHIRVVQIA